MEERDEAAIRVQILAATGNAPFAERLVRALEAQGYEIAGGPFDPRETDAAVIVWSGASIGSPEMIEAAALPLAHGALIPVSIGQVEPPPAFRHITPVNLAGWNGDPHDPRWRFVVDEIDRTAYAARLPAGAPALDAPRPAGPPHSTRPFAAGRAILLASFVGAAAMVLGGFFLLTGHRSGAGEIPAVAAEPEAAEAPAGPAPVAAEDAEKKGAADETPIMALAVPAPADQPPAKETPGNAPQADQIAALIAGAAAGAQEKAGVGETAAPAGPVAGGVFTDCAFCPEMSVIPAGTFNFGSPPGEPARAAAEGPVRSVTIARPFALATHETTFEEWDACVADSGCDKEAGNDAGWGRGSRPVVNVSWEDAGDYVRWLSGKTGKTYRLPSEEEWEYAARAGATTPFSFGAVIEPSQANFDATHPYGGAPGENRQRTTPVGGFAKNAFGLYDMHGNAWEWVEDCWAPDHGTAPADGSPVGGACERRVLKGGAWNTGGWRLRAGHRIGKDATAREFDNGFRVARDLD